MSCSFPFRETKLFHSVIPMQPLTVGCTASGMPAAWLVVRRAEYVAVQGAIAAITAATAADYDKSSRWRCAIADVGGSGATDWLKPRWVVGSYWP